MKTNYIFWIDSAGISRCLNCDAFHKLIDYCDASKIPYEVKIEVDFKDNNGEKNEHKTLFIEECWLIYVLCKVLDC